MSHLHTLLYVSRLSPGLSESDIAHILQSARKHNSQHRITGFLAFTGDNFLQVLEGPAMAVTNTLARILQDRRHFDSELLAFQPIHARRFASWSMGYAAVATVHQSTVQQYCGGTTLSAATITAAGAMELLVALNQDAAVMEAAAPAKRRSNPSLDASRRALATS